MSYPANLIAFAFVKKGIDQGKPVTQMKLQKLVYFAHGLHLALHKEPLIKEEFQAWKFGPVVPSIYQSYKYYGSAPITDTFWLSSLEEKNLDLLNPEAKDSIEYTWTNLNKFNAAKLSNWTHLKDSPWDKVFVEGVSDVYIPNELIEEYFKRFLVESNA